LPQQARFDTFINRFNRDGVDGDADVDGAAG